MLFDQFGARRAPAAPTATGSARRATGRATARAATTGGRSARRPARGFDHERTAYPLRGTPPRRRLRDAATRGARPAHRASPAVRRAARPAIATRTPASSRGAAGTTGCAACHDVDGWTPARYGIAEHDTRPLPARRRAPRRALRRLPRRGARPRSCPPRVPRAPPAGRDAPAGSVSRASPARDCHRDPHARRARRAGAPATERVRGLPRRGAAGARPLRPRRDALPARRRATAARPATPAIRASGRGRPRRRAPFRRPAARLRRLPPRRARAASSRRDGVTDCARCHDDRAASGRRAASTMRRRAYPLDGRHAAVPCAGCHPTETSAGRRRRALRAATARLRRLPRQGAEGDARRRALVTAGRRSSRARSGRSPALVAVAVVVPYLRRASGAGAASIARVSSRRARSASTGRSAQFPFVDPVHCIGCGACVRACPEGDVLGVVGGIAVVINGLRCVGHGRCADACPVGAIEVGLGDLKGAPTCRSSTRDSESTVPGVFVAGELSGLALIRNAVEQGAAVVETIAQRCAPRPRAADAEVADLLVVGAGPAGVAAALAAREAGLRACVVDQAAGPRRHDPPLPAPQDGADAARSTLPGGGNLAREEYTKEELLDLLAGEIGATGSTSASASGWRARAARTRSFTSVTTAGRHRARARRPGARPPRHAAQARRPRRGAAARSCTSCATPSRYRGQRILVVGGGDSAVEAAIGLARQPGNRRSRSRTARTASTASSRRTRPTIETMIERGRVRACSSSSEVVAIERGERRHCARGERTRDGVDNDYVFVIIGGEPPYRAAAPHRRPLRRRRRPARLAARRPGAPGSGGAVRRGAAIAGLLAGVRASSPAAARARPGEPARRAGDRLRGVPHHRGLGAGAARRPVRARHARASRSSARTRAADCRRVPHQPGLLATSPPPAPTATRDAHAGELGLDCASCHDPTALGRTAPTSTSAHARRSSRSSAATRASTARPATAASRRASTS